MSKQHEHTQTQLVDVALKVDFFFLWTYFASCSVSYVNFELGVCLELGVYVMHVKVYVLK